jgi:uncharacterized membrane protein YgaE (UPF0421/DUF939 family)
MKIDAFSKYIIARKSLPTPMSALRTAVAASASLLVARLLRLPNDYWAVVSCIIVMQSTLGTALAVSVQRFAGTAIGAAVAALAATYFYGNALAYGVSLFAIGMFCWALRIERSAFRYAGIALTIVMLTAHIESVPAVAFHRFLEVSIGIAVALVLTIVWPEAPAAAPESGGGAARAAG